jgi:hypothetical protein
MLRLADYAIFNRIKHTSSINCILLKFMLGLSSPLFAVLDCSLASLRLDSHRGSSKLCCCIAVRVGHHDEKGISVVRLAVASDKKNGGFAFGAFDIWCVRGK